MKEATLGLIETYGFIGAVEGLDVALKSANVKLVSCEFVTGGIVTILITGDVASVKASIEAACSAVDRLGTLRNAHVIARAEENVWNILDGKKKDSSKKIEEIPDKILPTKIEDKNVDVNDLEDNKNEDVLNTVENVNEADYVQESEGNLIARENEKVENKKNIKIKFEDRSELEALKVPELRTIARELKERKKLSLTKKQIKFSKKDQLIEAILKEQ